MKSTLPLEKNTIYAHVHSSSPGGHKKVANSQADIFPLCLPSNAKQGEL